MGLDNTLNLKEGQWLVANCGNIPSEKNCKLVIMAPENQRDDLVEAAVSHAIKTHNHQDSSELRNELNKAIETVSV